MPEEKQELLNRLIQVFGFERYLEKAYLGQKMFSIEGLDAVVPMLDEVFEMAHTEGAHDVVIGMAHRGRLSVLAHNIGAAGRGDPGRVRGRQGDRGRQVAGRDPDRRHRRRQVPLRPRRRLQDARRLGDRRAALSEPEPPRVRGPGGHRRRARLADQPPGRAPRARPDGRGPGPAPRRRGLPGPGRGRRDAQPPVAEGLRDRRHGPHHPEQPDRLHHRSGGGSLHPLRRRHGEGLQRPDHPRQRRRPRGLRRRPSAWRWPTASAGAATSSST